MAKTKLFFLSQTEYQRFITFFQNFQLENQHTLGQDILSSYDSLVNYKFYTNLIKELFELKLQYGIDIKQQIFTLSDSFRADRKNEYESWGAIKEALIQMIVIVGFMILFKVMATTFMEQKFEFFDYFLILIISLAGFTTFFIVTCVMKSFSYRGYLVFFAVLYRLKTLSLTQLSISEVIQKSGVRKLTLPKDFKVLEKRLGQDLDRWKKEGGDLSLILMVLIDELWSMLSRSNVSFVKQVNILKFCFLAFLILPMYFYFTVYQLFSQLSLDTLM